MPIIVKSECERLGVSTLDKDDMELCCFCRTPTEFWTEIENRPADHVACCESCASRAWEADVPSKSVWIRWHTMPSSVKTLPSRFHGTSNSIFLTVIRYLFYFTDSGLDSFAKVVPEQVPLKSSATRSTSRTPVRVVSTPTGRAGTSVV